MNLKNQMEAVQIFNSRIKPKGLDFYLLYNFVKYMWLTLASQNSWNSTSFYVIFPDVMVTKDICVIKKIM